MNVTVAQMSKEELNQMIAVAVEEKLLELLGDPDEGLEIRRSVRSRLVRQKKAVAAGERGEPFEDVARRLGLELSRCKVSAVYRRLRATCSSWTNLLPVESPRVSTGSPQVWTT